MSAPYICADCGQPITAQHYDLMCDGTARHELLRECLGVLKRALSAAEADRDRYRAALGAAKDEVARLREELRVVSRYAARLYDDVTEVSEALDAACYDDSPDAMGTARDRLDEALGVSDGIGVWTEALKRGREGR